MNRQSWKRRYLKNLDRHRSLSFIITRVFRKYRARIVANVTKNNALYASILRRRGE